MRYTRRIANLAATGLLLTSTAAAAGRPTTRSISSSGTSTRREDAGRCHASERESYRCTLYGSADYPDLCAQFNCVSWAKANDTYLSKGGPC